MNDMEQMPEKDVKQASSTGNSTRFKMLTGAFVLCCFVGMTIILSGLFVTRSQWSNRQDGYLYIDSDDTMDSVKVKSGLGWRLYFGSKLLKHIRTGRYDTRNQSAFSLFRKLRIHSQDPVNLTIPSVRTLDRMASYLSQHLMMDKEELLSFMSDSSKCAQIGFSPATLPSLFIPNTYYIYWDISVDRFIERMQVEYLKFWNDERLQKAEACHLTPIEVCTLASIVDEETANAAEKPDVAGMYLNRLHVGMPLQADPTVKFAIGDFTLKRIYHEHLRVESPYNTYIHAGLPPGPIRIASIEGIDAVLNHSKHDYLYMCAKEDFSGTHRFATTYQEHLRNARRYADALNQRGIN